MQLKHIKSWLSPTSGAFGFGAALPRVTSVACAANGRTAVTLADRYILLFDEDGVQRDRFPTKSSVNGSKSYAVRCLAFSPDSQKLAVAQSDNIVFVYKLGQTWNDKKSICNKYLAPSPVTCLCWPRGRLNEVVFGASDGKVRLGNTANKTVVLYSTDSYVVNLSEGVDGRSFVSSHVDGSIIRFLFSNTDTQSSSHALISRASFIPTAIAMTSDHILAAGNSSSIVVLDKTGREMQKLEYKSLVCKDFTCAALHPSGQMVVFGNVDTCICLLFNRRSQRWEDSQHPLRITQLSTITALAWRLDGTRLLVGSIFGALDAFDASLKRYIYKHDFEITYTSSSSLVVRNLATNHRSAISSKYSRDIHSIAIYKQQFAVAKSADTMIICDLNSGLQSEISWKMADRNDGSQATSTRFFWDADNCCIIYHAGELHVVEYGSNEISTSVRTEFASPHLISLRVSCGLAEAQYRSMAYLLDHQTVRVTSSLTSSSLQSKALESKMHMNFDVTIPHEHRIDWLELNTRGNKLLLRDRQSCVHMVDLSTKQRHVLLHYASYVQWVPNSDVVVAQSRRQLYVWYSITAMSDVTILPINGNVETIHRVSGKTEVIVEEGSRKHALQLDEPLIAFGSAIDAHDFENAVKILESFDTEHQNTALTSQPFHLNTTSNLRAMWQQLSKLAVSERNFPVAERCFAALGDMSNTAYLHEINATIALNNGDSSCWLVQALLCLIAKQFKRAENLYVSHGGVDSLIDMYRTMHKWSDALRIAEQCHHPEVNIIREDYFKYLTATQQEALAGELKAKEGDYDTALALYLKGGHALKAAELILEHGLHSNFTLCDRVATALISNCQFERAGDFLLALNQVKPAFDCYLKGKCFHRAVDLARRDFPGQVVLLEEQWGDHLFSQQQFDAACSHFIQSGSVIKALECAVEAKQWVKAQQMLENLEHTQAQVYMKRVAANLATTSQYNEAERLYVRAQCPTDAVNMYTKAGMWDKAHSIAVTYMSETEVHTLYADQALKNEAQGLFKEAEKLYVAIKAYDSVITMYRKHRLYDDMIRMYTLYRKDGLAAAQIQLGHQFQDEGNYRAAEQHFIEAKDWEACYAMYKNQQQWEDALRIAKNFGGQSAYKQSAYEFATAVGGEAATKMLVKRGLAELAVDVALERKEFDSAFAISEKTCKTKLPEIHLAYAMHLEDEGKFEAAEREFISARKPKEAIDMWIHQEAWENAQRVCHDFEPNALNEIVDAQVKVLRESKNFQAAETLLLSHKKAADAVRLYVDVQQWDEALRVAKQHAPRLVSQVQAERSVSTANVNTLEYSLNQARLCQSKRQFSQAIDHLLSITQDRCSDIDALTSHWESAVDLANEQCKTRVKEVVTTVTQRLLSMHRYGSASQFFVDHHQYEQAIGALIQGRDWDKAKGIAASHAPHLAASIQSQQSAYLLTQNNIQSLAEVNPSVAIDAYANSGEWDKMYSLASKQGEATLQKYASLHAATMLKQGKARSAVRVFLIHGCPILPANFPLYKRLAQDVLASAGDVENPNPSVKRHSALDAWSSHSQVVLQELRVMLWNLLRDLRAIDPTESPFTMEIDQLLVVTHFAHLRFLCSTPDLQLVLKRLSVCLLRYSRVLPVDKVFYDAGAVCRSSNDVSNAFVFFNRFVDLTDLMNDPNSGDIDHSDFLESDIPSPFETPLPSIQFYSDEVREEAREWVLEKAMSHDVAQNLVTRSCEKCSVHTYEASLICHHCHYTHEPCIISGYPVIKSKRITCGKCNKPANREDWNRYVARFKTCCWCGSTAAALY